MPQHVIEGIKNVIEHREEIRAALESGLAGEPLLLKLADILVEERSEPTSPILALGFALHSATAERMLQDARSVGALHDDDLTALEALQQDMSQYGEVVQAALRPAAVLVLEGRNRWAARHVERYLHVGTGVPLLRVTQMADDDELFETEESTHAFVANATGLLYSVAAAYKECNESGLQVSPFVKICEEWGVSRALRQLRKICEALDIDFAEVVAASAEEEEEEE